MEFSAGGTGNHAAAGDAFEIVSPSDAIVKLMGVTVTQEDLTAIENILVTISRIEGGFTSGSGGTTATPSKRETGFAASAITAELFNTTDLTAGTKVEIYREMWNVTLPFLYRPTPKEMKKASPTDGFLVEIGTPSAAIDIHVTAEWDEEGG